jgi:dimethylargininase
MTKTAITREVSEGIVHCELTHLERTPIDVDVARQQHDRYEACLASLGCRVTRLTANPQMPDSVFIEDIAVVLDEVAVITLPGAPSRRSETPAVVAGLEPHRPLLRITPPATLDGGDVLQVGKTLYVGLSTRSSPASLDQLRDLLKPFGYRLQGIPVQGCLHLKSAATLVAPDTLLINPGWVDSSRFGRMRTIPVHASEPFAANALLLDQVVVYPASYPATQERLEQAGISVQTVDVSELAKAEGGVTCCSLIFNR